MVLLRDKVMKILGVLFMVLIIFSCENKAIDRNSLKSGVFEKNKNSCIEIKSKDLDSLIFDFTKRLNKGVVNYNDTIFWKPKTITIQLYEEVSSYDKILCEIYTAIPRYKLIEDTNIIKINGYLVSLYYQNNINTDSFFIRDLKKMCHNPPTQILSIQTDMSLMKEGYYFNNKGELLGVVR